MPNSWVRLWHEMPTDPKWRVVARKSGQSISAVIAIYNCLMVNASANGNERGIVRDWDSEDIGAALDLDEQSVDSVIDAMQGKVLDGWRLLDWARIKAPGVYYGGRIFGKAWQKIRSRIFRRDDFTCQYCSVRGGRLECDHVNPLALGGSNDDSNLVTACFSCNRSKRAKSLTEWLA